MLETFRALAEPNRLQIVELLLAGPRPVGDMVDELGLRQPQVSKHLRVLSEAGLVDVRVDAQRRIYALRPAPLQELEAWLDRYRRLSKAYEDLTETAEAMIYVAMIHLMVRRLV